MGVLGGGRKVYVEKVYVFLLFLKSVQDSLKRASGVSIESFLRLQGLFQECFGYLLDPGAGRPWETLSETLRGFWTRRAWETPVVGLAGSHHKFLNRNLFSIGASSRDLPP